MTMSVIVYLPDAENAGDRLLEAIKTTTPKQIEIYHSLADLAARFQKPCPDTRITVLLAATVKHLQDIIRLRDYLLEMRLILVLPDGDHETIAQAHSLRPRFLTWMTNDFADVGVVLKRMVELYH